MCGIKVCDLGGAAFDWDHLDRDTKGGNVGSMVLSGEHIGPIRTEIAKCRLLCVRCHLDHTSKQLGYYDPVPKIKAALAKARIRTFNEAPLNLCSDSDSDSD
jgi:5-methylcytosine-specific restriction endonuclease McrA